MNNEQYFDYLLDAFDEENKLTKIILIGENNAVRLLVMDELKRDEQNENN